MQEVPSLKAFVPQPLLPAPRQEMPWWKSSRLHLAALFTGYAVWVCCAVLLIVAAYNIVAGLTGHLPDDVAQLPFARNHAMTGSRLLVDERSVRAWNGDGTTYEVWRLTGSPNEMKNLVTNEIWGSVVWFHRPFDERDRKALEFVRYGPGYEKAAPFVSEVQSGDFYFAYSQLRIYDDGRVGDAGIWLFSPDKMLLVYLNSNI